MSNYALGLADPRVDDQPLNAQEQQLMQRLFGDPLSIPMVFRTWLVNWLEISDIKLPQTAVLGLTTVLGTNPGETGAISLLNTGSIVDYAGTDHPQGTLDCNGAAYATSAQPDLFAVIGYSFGGASGNFNVPNLPGIAAGIKKVIVS